MAKRRVGRGLSAVLATALLGAGVLVATPASAVDVNHYVATTGVDTGNCQTEATPCLTINYAVGQATTGDIINVAAGTYAEKVLTAKSLTFRGANAGIGAGTAPGVRGPESVVKSIQTTGTAPLDITVDGFRVDPQGDATIVGNAPTFTQIQLVGGTVGSTIVNNVIVGSDAYYPQCNAGTLGPINGCAVPGQQMTFGGILVRSGPTEISDNRIEKYRYGIKLTQNNLARPLVANVEDNVITEVTVQGIGTGGATGFQQPGATITGNSIDAVGRLAGPGGIVMTNGGNTITENTFTDLGSAVYLNLCKKWDTRGVTVDDNTFNSAGVVIETGYDGGQCQLGTLGDTEGAGSWVVGGGRFDGFNANGNTFSGTSGFRSNSDVRWSANKPVTVGPIDITCNYWDSPTGPTTATNPGGTGRPLTFTEVGNPDFTYLPWEIANNGACTGGLATGPEVFLSDAGGLERDLVAGSVMVPVTLSKVSATPTVVSYYTVDGTAVAGQDYTRAGTVAVPRTYTIPAGQLQGTINVAVLTDAVVESEETFSVQLAGVSGGDVTVGNGTGVATIYDADGLAGPNPVINVSNGSIYEGDEGTRFAQFYIHLSRPTASPITVTYESANGSASFPGDFKQKVPGSVVFAAGQISKTIDVQINSDTDVEALKDFFLNVGVTGGSPLEELSLVGTSSILNDD